MGGFGNIHVTSVIIHILLMLSVFNHPYNNYISMTICCSLKITITIQSIFLWFFFFQNAFGQHIAETLHIWKCLSGLQHMLTNQTFRHRLWQKENLKLALTTLKINVLFEAHRIIFLFFTFSIFTRDLSCLFYLFLASWFLILRSFLSSRFFSSILLLKKNILFWKENISMVLFYVCAHARRFS